MFSSLNYLLLKWNYISKESLKIHFKVISIQRNLLVWDLTCLLGWCVPVSKPVDPEGNVFWIFNVWLHFQARYQMSWSGSLGSVETYTGPAFQILESFRVIYGYPGPWQLESGLTGSTEPLYKQLLSLAHSLLHSLGSRVTDGASEDGGSPSRQSTYKAGISTSRGRSLRLLYKIFMIITILPWSN